MKSRPILFSGPMVRAILPGHKTQTRRVVKQQGAILTDAMARSFGIRPPEKQNAPVISCPYGMPGDRLWVRETHAWVDWMEDDIERDDPVCVAYKADHAVIRHEFGERVAVKTPSWNWEHDRIRWRPSIHMPRWAARIEIEIVKVRVERLNDISDADAIAEGMESVRDEWMGACGDFDKTLSHKQLFEILWHSINGNRPKLPRNPASKRYDRVKRWLDKHPDVSRAANPWVWVIEFRRIK